MKLVTIPSQLCGRDYLPKYFVVAVAVGQANGQPEKLNYWLVSMKQRVGVTEINAQRASEIVTHLEQAGMGLHQS